MHTLTYFSQLRFFQKYFWSSFIALLLRSSWGSRIDSNYESSDRQQRQNVYRGNYKFQVPAYLSPDAYANTIYSADRRGPDGSFSYEYETDNAIKVKQESTGYGPGKVVRGYYSYVGDNGITYTTHYIADRFGYRAYGAHLPTQPDAIYDQTKLPVYNRPVINRPVSNPYYVTSSPAPSVYPLQPQPQQAVYPLQNPNYQHQTQTVYYPHASQPTQHIYVTDNPPSNFINITPKPFSNRVVTSTQPPPLNILPPYNYGPSSPDYSNPPHAWTTARPSYNSVFSSSTPRPYVSY